MRNVIKNLLEGRLPEQEPLSLSLLFGKFSSIHRTREGRWWGRVRGNESTREQLNADEVRELVLSEIASLRQRLDAAEKFVD